MRSKGIVRRAPRQDCVKAQICGRVPNNSAALKVPKNTGASIIIKWKKFGITKTLHWAGRPVKLSNRGRRALVREVTKNLMFTLTEFQRSPVEMGEPSRRTTISAALHQSGLYGRVTRRKPLFSKRHMTARLEFAKMHLKDSDHAKQDSLVWWNQDVTLGIQAKEFNLEETRHPSSPAVKCSGSIMLWGCFSNQTDTY